MGRQSSRRLTESLPQSGPLKVDRERGVIHRVRVLGPTSVNTYGVSGVDATEYSRTSHDDARRLYEGKTCGIDHVRDSKSKERSVRDVFGKFVNATTEDEAGGPATYADLHFLKSHPLAESVCEDVDRGLGVFGLSHDAYVGKERVDKSRKRLVIESLRDVNTVDLVWRPATNRNLWESEDQTMNTTFRAVLESLTALPPGKLAWRKLVEMDDTAMAAPVTAPSDPDEALAAGFRAAVMAVMDDSSLSVAEKKKKIGMLLAAQEKLAAKDDVEPPAEDKPESDSMKMESVLAENAKLKADREAEAAVRRLCESAKFYPTEIQVAALRSLADEPQRRALLESFRPSAGLAPRSGYSGGGDDGEYKPAKDGTEFLARLRK